MNDTAAGMRIGCRAKNRDAAKPDQSAAA